MADDAERRAGLRARLRPVTTRIPSPRIERLPEGRTVALIETAEQLALVMAAPLAVELLRLARDRLPATEAALRTQIDECLHHIDG
jgi:hypothetical protein